METSLKTGFAQVFSCCPKNLSCPKFGGAAAPLAPPARTPVGGFPYKSGGDALRLALGCKFQILVSLRLFEMESYYICPFRYRLVLCIKKFIKCPDTDHTEISLRGQFKLEAHPHWSPLRFKCRTSIPGTFIWESPRENGSPGYSVVEHFLIKPFYALLKFFNNFIAALKLNSVRVQFAPFKSIVTTTIQPLRNIEENS